MEGERIVYISLSRLRPLIRLLDPILRSRDGFRLTRNSWGGLEGSVLEP